MADRARDNNDRNDRLAEREAREPDRRGRERTARKREVRNERSARKFEDISPQFMFDPSDDKSVKSAQAQQLASDLFQQVGGDFGSDANILEAFNSATRKAAGLETSLFDKVTGIESKFEINPQTGMLDVSRSKRISPLGIASSILGGPAGTLIAEAVQQLGVNDPFAFNIPLGFVTDKPPEPIQNERDGKEGQQQQQQQLPDIDLKELVQQLLTAQTFKFAQMPQFKILDNPFGDLSIDDLFATLAQGTDSKSRKPSQSKGKANGRNT